jgi:hypothetical protein
MASLPKQISTCNVVDVVTYEHAWVTQENPSKSKHGKSCSFIVIKALIGIIAGYRYPDDLYGLS